jgi:predicted phage-related endonuclease
MKKNNEKTEYSEDYQFFLEHQVAVSYTNGKRWATIFSLLDGTCFSEIKQCKPINDRLIREVIAETHQGLIFKQQTA